MSALSSVRSRDGTAITYRERGEGPGVVLVHGAMQSAKNFARLTEALSASFRVYVPNRRGRGGSGPFGVEYGVAREVEDLDALLQQTGARFVFGLSSGALIALCAARALSSVAKLALYEPPLAIDGADPAQWVPRYRSEVDRGDLAAAMVTVLQGTGDVELMTYLPRLLLVPLVRLAIRFEAVQPSADRVSIRDLIPTVRYDALVQREATSLLSASLDVGGDVLLMGGDRSHRTLRVVLDEVARRLPSARRARFKGVGHLAADDTGRPLEVAEELRRFFGS